jgi:hypothetical protein
MPVKYNPRARADQQDNNAADDNEKFLFTATAAFGRCAFRAFSGRALGPFGGAFSSLGFAFFSVFLFRFFFFCLGHGWVTFK